MNRCWNCSSGLQNRKRCLRSWRNTMSTTRQKPNRNPQAKAKPKRKQRQQSLGRNRMSDSIYAGTSGWAYAGWKPEFYPKEVPAKDFLKYYARQVNSVEVNFT